VSSLWKLAINRAIASASDGEPERISMNPNETKLSRRWRRRAFLDSQQSSLNSQLS
jgi:hypothetical protein